MQFSHITYSILFLLYSVLSYGQLSNGMQENVERAYQISSIDIVGNEKTDEQFILNQLMLDRDENYQIDEIADHVKQLSSLDGLYDVDFSFEHEDGGNEKIKIQIVVKEQITLLPVVNLGQADQYRWFQLGFAEVNLFGRGSELYAYYQNNGGRHAGQIYYRDPQIGKSKFGYAANLLRWQSVEPLFFNGKRVSYNYDNNLAGLTGYYNKNRFLEFELGTSLFNEVYTLRGATDDSGVFPSKVNLIKGLVKVGASYDKLKYHFNLIDGYSFKTAYQYVHTFDNNDRFNILEGEFKYFKMYYNKEAQKQSNFALRIKAGVASNSNSPFSPFVIDSYQNVRGAGDRIQRGTAIVTINTEYRKQIWFDPDWSVQGVVFADFGAIRTAGSNVTEMLYLPHVEKFAGIGTRIIYEKLFNAILRIDYAVDINDFSNRSVVFGLGQYF